MSAPSQNLVKVCCCNLHLKGGSFSAAIVLSAKRPCCQNWSQYDVLSLHGATVAYKPVMIAVSLHGIIVADKSDMIVVMHDAGSFMCR